MVIELSAEEGGMTLLVDSTPDLRYQCLRAGLKRLDAVVFTHSHADHVYGIDDLRAFNFVTAAAIPLFAAEDTACRLEMLFSYAFMPDEDYQGGAPPRLELNRIRAYEPVRFGKIDVMPVALKHGNLDILGFRCGGFAYLTDCSSIPEKSREYLRGLDVLIIDGLRPKRHRTHFNHEQAVLEIERLQPRRAYLTHLSHDISHADCNARLQQMTTLPVQAAYDGLTFDL